jgi:hypothetical protein
VNSADRHLGGHMPHLDTNSSPAELGRELRAATRAGRTDTALLIQGIRFIADANRIDDLIATADRLQLAAEHLRDAIHEGQRLNQRHNRHNLDDEPRRVWGMFRPQYIRGTLECLEEYHRQRLAVIEGTTSRIRQTKSTNVTIRKLLVLDGRYEEPELVAKYTELLNYWHDQLALLATSQDEK